MDIGIIAFLALWIAYGIRKGFLHTFFRLALFAGAWFTSLAFYSRLALLLTRLAMPLDIANLLSFCCLFAGALLLLSLVLARAHLIFSQALDHPGVFMVNKITGVVPSLIAGVMSLLLLLAAIGMVPFGNTIEHQVALSGVGYPLVNASELVGGQLRDIIGNSITLIGKVFTGEQRVKSSRLLIPKNVKARYDDNAERLMLELINKERSQRGLNPLIQKPQLTAVARKHSLDMLRHGFFSHKSPSTGYLDDRLIKARYYFLAAGENLSYTRDIMYGHEALMGSEEHRDNILRSRYADAGIGIVNAGKYGYICTQVFTN